MPQQSTAACRSDLPVATPTSSREPQLRATRVPWLELDNAVNASIALAHLLVERIERSRETIWTDPELLAGLNELEIATTDRLRALTTQALHIHRDERRS
jgi:hypothetical protein